MYQRPSILSYSKQTPCHHQGHLEITAHSAQPLSTAPSILSSFQYFKYQPNSINIPQSSNTKSAPTNPPTMPQPKSSSKTQENAKAQSVNPTHPIRSPFHATATSPPFRSQS